MAKVVPRPELTWAEKLLSHEGGLVQPWRAPCGRHHRATAAVAPLELPPMAVTMEAC